MTTTPPSAWTIRADADGTHHTHCPALGCGAWDSIYEVEHAIRWNRLTLWGDDGLNAVAHLGDGNYDSAGWICAECLTEFDEAPEGFEVLDWC